MESIGVTGSAPQRLQHLAAGPAARLEADAALHVLDGLAGLGADLAVRLSHIVATGGQKLLQLAALLLAEALKANFPATASMVDERFFAYAAAEFLRRHPPRQPRLAEYGRELPEFLAAFEPAGRTDGAGDRYTPRQKRFELRRRLARALALPHFTEHHAMRRQNRRVPRIDRIEPGSGRRRQRQHLRAGRSENGEELLVLVDGRGQTRRGRKVEFLPLARDRRLVTKRLTRAFHDDLRQLAELSSFYHFRTFSLLLTFDF